MTLQRGPTVCECHVRVCMCNMYRCDMCASVTQYIYYGGLLAFVSSESGARE